MLVLLNQDWPWIGGGLILIVWGICNLQLSPKQWVRFCLNLLFINFSEPTKSEKRVAAATSVDDAMVSNPGCALVVVGLACLIFGLVRWLG